ncbi:MAG: VaFE repeat-containing surface-anchored protein, partial [Lachnospiraceae bacterium]
MKKMKKRVMAWMMVLTMLLTLVPNFGAKASETVPDVVVEETTEASTEDVTEQVTEESTGDAELESEPTTETTTEVIMDELEVVTEEAIEELEVVVDNTSEADEELQEDRVIKYPGDQWEVIGVASPSIVVNGRRIIGSQYSVRKIATGEVLGGWCYNHNAKTAAVGSGLIEAAGTNQLVAISCLVAQGNGAMANYYYGFNWQGYNPEVVATLANSILSGNSAPGSFGTIVDNYVNYIRSLAGYFTLIHPNPEFTNNNETISQDMNSGLYYSKSMQLQVPEDSNTLTWVADTVLPDGVYAKVTESPITSVSTSNCYMAGQTVTLQSNQYVTYFFDPNKIPTNKMLQFEQGFTLNQYIIDSMTFTPHGGYQPVIYASYRVGAATAQMGELVHGRLTIRKLSGYWQATADCSIYSLAGAEYVLKDEFGRDARFIIAKTGDEYVYGNTSLGKLITNKDGWLTYTFRYVGDKKDITEIYNNVTGNNPYTITFDKSNKMYVDMGTYRLSETKASPGYQLDKDCQYTLNKYHEAVITQNNRTAAIICKEEPILDPVHVKMEKKDSETGEINPVGAGSLAGAVFEVDYYNGKYTKANLPGNPTRKWFFKTDKNGSWDFMSSKPLNNSSYHSDAMYDGRKIPFGTITIKEVTAPEGYLTTWDMESGSITIDGNTYSDNKMVLYQILPNESNTAPQLLLDGRTVTSGNQVITIQAYDPVKRGNIAFDKREYNSDNPMPYMAFIMESMTTHEKHIIVTDENGRATTDMSAFGNNNDVNGNDKYLDDLEHPDVINNQLRPTPVWFYGTADTSQWNPDTIDKTRGALPYDTYTFTEIASDGNAHTRLIEAGEYTAEIKEDKDSQELVIYDMELPSIHTTALSADTNDHIAGAYKTAKVIDTVEYEKLYPETKYKLVGTAMNCSTGKPIEVDGKPLTREAEFTTASAERLCHGYQDVVFEFDATLLRGITMVVFEKLYLWDEQSGDWVYITNHEDINDAGQTVHFTDIHTTATDNNTQSHDSYAVREVTIT